MNNVTASMEYDSFYDKLSAKYGLPSSITLKICKAALTMAAVDAVAQSLDTTARILSKASERVYELKDKLEKM